MKNKFKLSEKQVACLVEELNNNWKLRDMVGAVLYDVQERVEAHNQLRTASLKYAKTGPDAVSDHELKVSADSLVVATNRAKETSERLKQYLVSYDTTNEGGSNL